MTRQELLDALTAERFAPAPRRAPRPLAPISRAAGRQNLRRLAQALKPSAGPR